MTDQTGLRQALANCLPRLRLYWKPLVFLIVPITFGVGFLGVQTAEEPVKPVSVVIGGVTLCFVAGLAAASEQFKAWAAGAPFMTLGLFAGAMFSLAGFSWTLFGSIIVILVATAFGLFCGLASQRE